jgi:hypothetical protein
MPEKIIANTITGASEHFIELINEGCNVSETHLILANPVSILVEDPTACVNTFIRHNPLDVLLHALWVLTGCQDKRGIEKLLDRTVRDIPLRKLFVVGRHIETDRFAVRFCFTEGNENRRYLDAYVYYEEAEAYEFLIEDFATISMCLQFFAASLGCGVGHVRIKVDRPMVHKENVDQFYWNIESGWYIGLANFQICDVELDRFISEATLLTQTHQAIGFRTRFLRRVALPAVQALYRINEPNYEAAYFSIRSMPGGVDWSAAAMQWYMDVFGSEIRDAIGAGTQQG